MADGWLRAGRVGRPHGLDGSFHVAQATPRLLEMGMPVMINSQLRRIVRRAGQDARPIIALEGCHDRTAAEALQGQELLVARAGAPTLPEDEWWADDLEGCTVRDRERVVGRVARLMGFPSVDVLEVARAEGGDPLLVPLVSEAVRAVDVERREIDVDLRFLGQE
ncbi:MAG: ribosome maturation factor RimM [Solirubrobacteraceae bacterium]